MGTGLSFLGPQPESGGTEQLPASGVSDVGLCRLGSQGCGLVLPGQVLSELLHSGAYHPGLSREPRGLSAQRKARASELALLIPRCREAARQSQSLLPAPRTHFLSLPGVALPPNLRSGPWASCSASAPNRHLGGGGPATEGRSAPARGGLAGVAGPRAAVRWRRSQDSSHAVTQAASMGTPGHCLRLRPALNLGGVESKSLG